MRNAKQIITNTYETNPKLKQDLEAYGLTLDEVGLHVWDKNPYKPNKQAIDSNAVMVSEYNPTAPIILGYSLEDQKVVSRLVVL